MGSVAAKESFPSSKCKLLANLFAHVHAIDEGVFLRCLTASQGRSRATQYGDADFQTWSIADETHRGVPLGVIQRGLEAKLYHLPLRRKRFISRRPIGACIEVGLSNLGMHVP